METAFYLGIDVSSKTLVCCLKARGRKDEEFSVPNDPKGLERLQERLGEKGARTRVVLEATSRYHLRAQRFLSEMGAEVQVLNPRRARALAEGLGRLDKDDKVDAEVLARAAQVLEEDPATPSRSPLHEELRDLSRFIDTQTGGERL